MHARVARNHLILAAWSQPARPLRKSLLHQPGERRRPATRVEPWTCGAFASFGAPSAPRFRRVAPGATTRGATRRKDKRVGRREAHNRWSIWVVYLGHSAMCVRPTPVPSVAHAPAVRCGSAAHVHAVCTLSARYLYAICEPVVATAVDSLIDDTSWSVRCSAAVRKPGRGTDWRRQKRKGVVQRCQHENALRPFRIRFTRV